MQNTPDIDSSIQHPNISPIELSIGDLGKSTRKMLSPTSIKFIEEAYIGQYKYPDMFGLFNSSADYINTVQLLIDMTDETVHRGLFFYQHVLPYLTHLQHFLDIGPGAGLLTNWVAQRFKQLTILDPSDYVLEHFQLRGKKNIKVTSLKNSIEKITLPSKAYDLINLSHILYHLPQQQWFEVIQKTYNALKPKGLLIVTLNGGLGREALVRHYGGSVFNTLTLATACLHLTGSRVNLFQLREEVMCCHVSTLSHIAGLFLADAGVVAFKDDLFTFLDTTFKTEIGHYKIPFYQSFIIIGNNGSRN